MARPPDAGLEDRLLHAAAKLWKTGGEKALTLRAVAQAAGSNTPAFYRRFRNREDMLRMLSQQIRDKVFRQLKAASSMQDACERYLDFALRHSNEYQLFYLHEHGLSSPVKSADGKTLNQVFKEKRPVVEFMKGKLAAQLGGTLDDYTRLTLTLWALLHGTAMLLIVKTIQPQHAEEMREACRASVEILLREATSSSVKK
jgi:AcrR family transcriptional regulator